MPRVTRLACRAIVAVAQAVADLACRAINWANARVADMEDPWPVTSAPTWAEAAADARADRWAGPVDYRTAASAADVVRCMNRDGIGR